MPNPPFTIRAGQPSECTALTKLCLRSKAHWGHDKAFMDQCRDSLTLTPERLLMHPTRVAQADSSQPVGVCAYSLTPQGADVIAELELLFVEPRAMGQGIGQLLLDDTRQILKALGHEHLWILSDPDAEDFYLMQGAQRFELRPSDCIPGRDLPWLRMPCLKS